MSYYTGVIHEGTDLTTFPNTFIHDVITEDSNESNLRGVFNNLIHKDTIAGQTLALRIIAVVLLTVIL